MTYLLSGIRASIKRLMAPNLIETTCFHDCYSHKTTNLSVGVIIESDTQQSGFDAMSYLGTMKLEREHLFSNECFLDKFWRKKN